MKNIQQLVDETLESLSGIQKAESNPYLYTRIEQRIKNKNATPHYQRRLMPVLAIALVLFISLNVVSYFKVSTNDSATSSTKSGSGVEGFANEYNLSEETGL